MTSGEMQDLEKEIDESSEFKCCMKGAIRKSESQNAPKHMFKSQAQE